MAECCIQSFKVPSLPLVKVALGSGRLHRFLLSSTPQPIANKSNLSSGSSASSYHGNSSRGAGNLPDIDNSINGKQEHGRTSALAIQHMTLAHAHRYLQNALLLINRYDTNGSKTAAPESITPASRGGTKGKNKGSSMGPSQPMSLEHVKQVVLLNSAYVSLHLNNPVQAILHAKALLAMQNYDPSTEIKARLYCAEAQVWIVDLFLTHANIAAKHM